MYATLASTLQAVIAEGLEASAARAHLCQLQLEAKAVSLSGKQVCIFIGLSWTAIFTFLFPALCWHA